MPATATTPMSTCDLDDLEASPAWTEGLRALEAFVREVGEDQSDAVVPWRDSRAGWNVGELEVAVLWVYGSPVVEMRTRSEQDHKVQKRMPLAETVIQMPSTSSQSTPAQDPVSKDGLWEELRAMRAA